MELIKNEQKETQCRKGLSTRRVPRFVSPGYKGQELYAEMQYHGCPEERHRN